MAQSKSNINPTWILLGFGVVLAWPLIKAAFGLTNLAGDILSAPADLARALNEETDNAIKEEIYKLINGYVSTHTYKPGDPESEYWMDFLSKSNDPNKNYFITKFREKKGISLILAGATYALAIHKINEFLKRF